MGWMTGRLRNLRAHGARCRRDGAAQGTALTLAALLVAAGALDVLSTNASLAAGNTEDNPLVAALQRGWGVWWFVPKMAVHLALAAVVPWLPSRRMIRHARAGVLLYAAIVAGNLHLAGWTL